MAVFDLPGYKESRLSLPVSQIGYRYVKLIINNGDSPHVKVTGIKGFYFPKYILFPCKTGESYRLYLGNKSAKAPVYDLSTFSSRVMESDPPLWGVSETRPNPVFTDKQVTPESEKHKWLLPAVLALLVVGLTMLIIRLVPKVTKEQ